LPDVAVIPLLRARALPGGPIERAFYETTKAELLQGLRRGGPWDFDEDIARSLPG